MSFDDIALVLIRPGEDSQNPYLIHTMTNGQGVEAIVRTEGTPILTRAEYEQERNQWQQYTETLGKRYVDEQSIVEPIVQQVIAHADVNDPIAYRQQYIQAAVRAVFQSAEAKPQPDYEVMAAADLTRQVI